MAAETCGIPCHQACHLRATLGPVPRSPANTKWPQPRRSREAEKPLKSRLFLVNWNGEGEIRTRATLAGRPVFETGAFSRSATSPERGRNSSGFERERQKRLVFESRMAAHACHDAVGCRSAGAMVKGRGWCEAWAPRRRRSASCTGWGSHDRRRHAAAVAREVPDFIASPLDVRDYACESRTGI